MITQVKNIATELNEELLSIRRHLHQNPELSFKEFKTNEFIQAKLTEWGISYTSGWVETGIVAIIEGNNPSSKIIALRGDIDGLPIQEENEVDYASCNPGVMHACGHDVHTTCVLGAAKILNDLKDQFEGTVKILFQPGEELLPGGASLMIQQGALRNPDASSIVGQHVYPELEVGKVGFRSGMYMASADEIHVTIKGKGGHAALPDRVIDPVLISAHLITALQQIVSRNNSPQMPSVLSFGYVQANGATNIIPDEVKLKGTFRTFDEEWRKTAHQKMTQLATGLVEGMGGKVDFDIRVGYPYLENDVELTNICKVAAVEYLGKENVIDLDLRMTAEDFSYYSQEIPSTFYRLGTRNEANDIVSGLHTSTFNVDESALAIGTGLMAWLALNQLKAI